MWFCQLPVFNTTMKRATLITIFTVLAGTQLLGNFNDLIFRFSARHTCLHTQMDSILIENLTSQEYWMLYYPDTIFTLISTSLTGIDAGTGELKIRNYPNPFKGQTYIELFVPETDRFQIRIYDIAGRMASFFEDWFEQGMHKFTFYSGDQNAYLLSVNSRKYSESLLMLQQEGAIGVKPRIDYYGRNMEPIIQSPVKSGMRTMNKSYDPSFDAGDEMRFTAFVTTLTGEVDLVPWVNNFKTIDYHKLFLRLGIEDLVVGHGIKEIWMSIFPKDAYPSVILNGYDDPSTYYGFPESNMSSPTTGDISNSWRIPHDLPVYSSTYVVYGHSNHRGVDTFLHNRGHQIEAQMHYIEKNKVPGNQLFWNKFIGYVNGIYTQRCGNTHFPPNGEYDYDYANPKIVNSDIQNWIPAGGQKSPVNFDTWTKIVYDIDMRVNRFGFYMDNYHSDPHTKWLLYWFQSIPGQNNNIPYQRDGKTYMLNNWWDLFYNWDDAINNNLTLWNENEIIN